MLLFPKKYKPVLALQNIWTSHRTARRHHAVKYCSSGIEANKLCLRLQGSFADRVMKLLKLPEIYSFGLHSSSSSHPHLSFQEALYPEGSGQCLLGKLHKRSLDIKRSKITGEKKGHGGKKKRVNIHAKVYTQKKKQSIFCNSELISAVWQMIVTSFLRECSRKGVLGVVVML